MKLMEWKKTDKKFNQFTLEEKFFLTLGFILFLFCSAAIIYGFYYESRRFFFSNESLLYIRESGSLISIITLLPFTFYMMLAALQKISGFRNKRAVINMIKCGSWGVPMFFTFFILGSFIIESNLKGKGYSYCYWYTGPSVRNADVWMKDESFCLQDGSLIRSDVLDWFDTHQKLGTEPTLEALNKFINEENSRIEKEIYGQ